MKSRWTGFQSPLADGIRKFLAYKRSLGCRFDVEERALQLLDRYLVEMKVTRMCKITSALLDRFLASRPRSTPRSYNHLLGAVRRLFQWCVNHGLLIRSPLQAIPKRQSAHRRPSLFDPPMARRLLRLASRLQDNPRAPMRALTYRTVFGLLYGLGLRVGEVARLTVGDVDWNRRLLVIRQTKFLKDRLVPFGPRIAALLRRFLHARKKCGEAFSPDVPLFSFVRGRHIHPASIGRVFHELVPKLKFHVPPGTLPPRVHHLRLSFAVRTLLRWYRTGVDANARLLQLSTFLGHVDPASTAVYLTITDELLEHANRRFETFARTALRDGAR